MKKLGWLAGLVNAKWKIATIGGVGVALLTALILALARWREAGVARDQIAADLAIKTLAYNRQAETIKSLRAEISTYQCSAGWQETVKPDGTIERRCAGIMGGSSTVTVYVDRMTAPQFPPSDTCPPAFYPLGLAGDVTASRSAFAWNAGPTYEWATGWSGKAAVGQINGDWAGTIGVQVRFPKKSKTESGGK